MTRVTDTLREDRCTCLILSHSFLVRMRNFSEKLYENENTHTMFNKFLLDNRAFCEIMWKNIVEPDRSQITIWRMRIACWKPKATNTHS
jgi:hypothetical protein